MSRSVLPLIKSAWFVTVMIMSLYTSLTHGDSGHAAAAGGEEVQLDPEFLLKMGLDGSDLLESDDEAAGGGDKCLGVCGRRQGSQGSGRAAWIPACLRNIWFSSTGRLCCATRACALLRQCFFFASR